jgi:hypothetical protein
MEDTAYGRPRRTSDINGPAERARIPLQSMLVDLGRRVFAGQTLTYSGFDCRS